MPLTATHEEIKAYQERVEKGKITSDGLDPCPRCNLATVPKGSGHGKWLIIHEKRLKIGRL